MVRFVRGFLFHHTRDNQTNLLGYFKLRGSRRQVTAARALPPKNGFRWSTMVTSFDQSPVITSDNTKRLHFVFVVCLLRLLGSPPLTGAQSNKEPTRERQETIRHPNVSVPFRSVSYRITAKEAATVNLTTSRRTLWFGCDSTRYW